MPLPFFGRPRVLRQSSRFSPSEALFSPIVEGAPQGILVADMRSPGARIVYVNASFEKITGYRRDEAVGKNCRYLQGSDRLQPEIAAMREALAAGRAVDVRLRNYRKDGSLFWNDLHLAPVDGGGQHYYVGFIHDVTEAVDTSSKLQQITDMDRLTGCLNRDALVQRLASRTKANRVLLVKADCARFHEINSGYGYDIGDALLQVIAQRLLSLGADLVARVGSDQFALAFSLEGEFGVIEILKRLKDALAERFRLPGADLSVHFAVGFVVGVPGAHAMTLVRQAGAALADSKGSPLKRPSEYMEERQERARDRLRMTSELQRALSANEFIYHYQPQVDLATGSIVGAEALVRWEHALFGMQQPSRFITLAEETGLILDISASGLRDVMSFAARFNRDRKDHLSFSFNVSSIELTHRDLISFVSVILEETGADPAWLTLELTESLFAGDSPEILSIFKRLRDLGIGLSIDDFGTGYSSLRYLERFPITEIKIDRSFVSGLALSSAKRVIVEAVIKLGAELGVRVVGEGVEHDSERNMLIDLGCAIGQGYLFGPPATSAALESLVSDGSGSRWPTLPQRR